MPDEPKRKISLDQVKLRMAYVLCDYFGLSTSANSKDIYEKLNSMGWHWMPNRLCWQRLGEQTNER